MPANSMKLGPGDDPGSVCGPQSDKREWIAVAAIVAIGLGLRLLSLDGQSLTMDEVTELNVARRSTDLSGLVKGARRFPPLYHLVLRGWQAILPGDLSARALSVVLGSLAIIVVYFLAKRLAGSRVAFFAAALVAISPFHNWYSQETRVYGLVFLVAALTLLMFFRALETGLVRDWVLFTLASSTGLFTHYYFPVLLILTAGIAAWDTRGDRERRRRALAAHCALALVGVPWTLLLIQDLRSAWGPSRFARFGFSGLGYTYLSFFTGYTLGPSLRELHTLGTREAVVAMLGWLAVIAGFVSVLARSGFRTLGGTRWRASLMVLAVAPVVLVGLASEVGPFGYNVRHVAWVFIPVAIWIGAGLSRWRSSRTVVVAGLALVIISGIALANRHRLDRYRNEDARALARFLESTEDRPPIFVSADYMAVPLDHYLDDAWNLTAIPTIRANGSEDRILAHLSNQVATFQHVWFAYSRPFHGDPEGTLLDVLEGRHRVELSAQFAGFRLYRITALCKD